MAEPDLDAIARAMSSVAEALAAPARSAPAGAPTVVGVDLLRASRQLLDSVELQMRRGGAVELAATPTTVTVTTVTVTVTVKAEA